MGLEKIIKQLKHYLNDSDGKNKAVCAHIDELLEKLEKKEKKLHEKIEAEDNSDARKKLKTELKVVQLQIKKGHKKRKEIRKNR
jgi:Skp family chaperone for outer membrane proteins